MDCGYQTVERSIVQVKAAVMLYDDARKQWLHSGESSGVSKVQIYRHTINNTFRVVGKNTDREVTINCMIGKNLRYNQATSTFHQWRDNRQVYGLNFAGEIDADQFAEAMAGVLDVLNNAEDLRQESQVTSQVSRSGTKNQRSDIQSTQPAQQVHPKSFASSTTNHYNHCDDSTNCNPLNITEDFENDATSKSELEQKRRTSEAGQLHRNAGSNAGALSPSAAPALPASLPPTSTKVKTTSDITSITPAAPALLSSLPPMPMKAKIKYNPAETATAQGAVSPPPPPAPPPPPSLHPAAQHILGINVPVVNDAQSSALGLGLSDAIKGAKLRKVTKTENKEGDHEPLAPPTNYASTASTIGRSGAPTVPAKGNIMSEMARKLQERKVKAESSSEIEIQNTDNAKQMETQLTHSGPFPAVSLTNIITDKPSPRPPRSSRASINKLSQSISQDSSVMQVTETGTTTSQIAAQLESIKQELLMEIRNEFQKIKLEIIEAVVTQMNKQSLR